MRLAGLMLGVKQAAIQKLKQMIPLK